MKKMYIALFVSVVVFNGCVANSELPENESDEADVVQTEVDILKDKIEDLSNYTVVEDVESELNRLPMTYAECVNERYNDEYVEKIKNGEVKKIVLFSGNPEAWTSDIDLYLIPNYDNWTEDDFDYVDSCTELGTFVPLKIVSDYIVWGWPACAGGAAPTPEQAGEAYVDFEKCLDFEALLNEYLAD